MAELRFEKVTKQFGNLTAINNLNLEIHHSEFFCFLGPPGAGKTTTLRLMVGLEKPDAGRVYIGSRVVNDLHPRQRDIAMIFQNLALYPDKTVFDNIAFPLRERKTPANKIREQVTATAQVLHIERLLDRKPGKLSGGERQRVAIARAIVRCPQAYLMDEPLANLDALLRLEMRVELKRLQKELGQTLVYVTNDQVEAMSMADRIAVLHKGVVQQCDAPETIYNLPANRIVATIVGSPPMNFIACRVEKSEGALQLTHPRFTLRARGENHPLWAALGARAAEGAEVIVGVRPEDAHVSDSRPSENAIPAQVSVVEPLGAETIVDLKLDPHMLKAIVPPTQRLNERQDVWLTFDLAKIHVIDKTTGVRLYTTERPDALELAAVNGYENG